MVLVLLFITATISILILLGISFQWNMTNTTVYIHTLKLAHARQSVVYNKGILIIGFYSLVLI